MSQTVGLVHPGKMGASVGAAAKASGQRVIWASEGRSGESKARAASAALEDVGTLRTLAQQSDVIVCVCPPHAATEVAQEVSALGFQGHYVEANAISPERSKVIAATLEGSGATFSDGSIIGPPAWQADTTRLYVSGPQSKEIRSLFEGSALNALFVSDEVGAASALKMSFSAWTKGTSALLLAIRALAKENGVEQALLDEWAVSIPDLSARSERVMTRTPQKAWRFAGEMEEIAATFATAGLPAGFHLAAAEVYERLAGFKGVEEADGKEVLTQLLEPHQS